MTPTPTPTPEQIEAMRERAEKVHEQLDIDYSEISYELSVAMIESGIKIIATALATERLKALDEAAKVAAKDADANTIAAELWDAKEQASIAEWARDLAKVGTRIADDILSLKKEPRR